MDRTWKNSEKRHRDRFLKLENATYGKALRKTYYYLITEMWEVLGKPEHHISGVPRIMVRLAACVESWLCARGFMSNFTLNSHNDLVK